MTTDFRAGMFAAAEICDALTSEYGKHWGATGSMRCADAIRAAAEKLPEAQGDDARDARLKANQARLLTLAEKFSKTMQCNCDLDNWEPEKSTGHSWVCRIHKAAIAAQAGDGGKS